MPSSIDTSDFYYEDFEQFDDPQKRTRSSTDSAVDFLNGLGNLGTGLSAAFRGFSGGDKKAKAKAKNAEGPTRNLLYVGAGVAALLVIFLVLRK